MTEISRPWSGTVIGDAGPYTDQNWRDAWEQMFTRRFPSFGVLRNSYSEFLATGAASPIAIAAGAAMINGLYYESDGSVNITVPTPAGATRIDRIVLRKTWATQQARLTRIAGVEGAGVPPALTQVDGNTWDIPLWQASITVGGVITLTDERQWIPYMLQLGAPYTGYANTVAENIAAEWLIPANFLGAGGGFRVALTFIRSFATDNVLTTVRWKFGGATIFSLAHNLGIGACWWELIFDIMNSNVTNAQKAYAWSQTRTRADSGGGVLAAGVFGGVSQDQAAWNTAAIDTTLDQLAQITIQMNVAGANDLWYLNQAQLYAFRRP